MKKFMTAAVITLSLSSLAQVEDIELYTCQTAGDSPLKVQFRVNPHLIGDIFMNGIGARGRALVTMPGKEEVVETVSSYIADDNELEMRFIDGDGEQRLVEIEASTMSGLMDNKIAISCDRTE